MLGRPRRSASACSTQAAPGSSAWEKTDTVREPELVGCADDDPDLRRPTARTTSGACSINSSTTGHPTSSPARITSSTNPAPGKRMTPPTAWSASHG